MAQAVATNFRRRLLGTRSESSNDALINSHHYYLTRSSIHIDRRFIEKVWKQMDRIVKYCQMPKMNLKNSPPYMLDILPDLYQTLKDIIRNYEERLHILNEIEYFRIFLDNLMELCAKMLEGFKRAGQHMYDEQSNYRKDFIKFSLYFSHHLTELKSLFNNGIYEGEKFRLTKQEANEFWKSNFNERIIVPWEEFKEKLNDVHSVLTDQEAMALQNTIDLTNNNHVSIFEFDVFTRLFHPWSSLLTNWKLLAVTHPGFMAFLTYDEVKAILTKYLDKPGSYLFRLSCTRLGQWAIGYVTTQKTILQTIPQTKPLIQSLIDGEREGYYKYPVGQNIHIDLSSALKPRESNRIDISREQYAIYCNMGTSFELCKICSVNNKNSRIQPCGHLLCQSCLIAWQNQNNSKPPALCPFCRSEIKGFESVVINPFESVVKENPKQSNLHGPDDQKIDSNPTIQTLAITRSINNDNSSADHLSTTPPPIPPRPVNLKSNINQSPINNPRRFQEILPPPLHNNDVLLLPQQPSVSNQSLPQLFNASGDVHHHSHSRNETLSLSSIDQFRTIDDIRSRLISEINLEQARIDAALVVTDGFSLSKQYAMAKLFLNQVKYEQEQLLKNAVQ